MKKTILKLTLLNFFVFMLCSTSCNKKETVIVPDNKGDTSITGHTILFTFTTQSTGGDYRPNNVLAAWIEDENGAFLRTLALYGKEERFRLYTWIQTTGSNKVDASTGATRRDHGQRTIEWNRKDKNQNIITDGKYKFRLELTDKNEQGALATFVFPLTSTNLDTNFNDQSVFSNINIKHTLTTIE